MMTSYDAVMRTIVELPEEQLQALDAWCAGEGVSRAEGVRRAVSHYLVRERPSARDEAFGLWRGRRMDGLSYQRKLRGEWDNRP
jgi:hypothetical protein